MLAHGATARSVREHVHTDAVPVAQPPVQPPVAVLTFTPQDADDGVDAAAAGVVQRIRAGLQDSATAVETRRSLAELSRRWPNVDLARADLHQLLLQRARNPPTPGVTPLLARTAERVLAPAQAVAVIQELLRRIGSVVQTDDDDVAVMVQGVLLAAARAVQRIDAADANVEAEVGVSRAQRASLLASARQVHAACNDDRVHAAMLALLSEDVASVSQLSNAVPSLADMMLEGHASPALRLAAMAALLRLHHRNLHLPVRVFSLVAPALSDPDERVRLAVLPLLLAVAETHPAHVTASGKRLIDQVFARLCSMVVDASPRVRTRACAMLGSLVQVQPQVLLQTLSKKLLKQRRRAPGTDRGQPQQQQARGDGRDAKRARVGGTSSFVPHSEGAGSRRRKNSEHGIVSASVIDPEGDVDVAASEDINLVDAGAAGAFIHGLEDEYQSVRLAAIDSLLSQSRASRRFAARALDYLADMLNDEIDLVRQRALNALQELAAARCVDFAHEHVVTILTALKDAQSELRVAALRLLASMRYPSVASYDLMVHALLDALTRYPGDASAVYRTLADSSTAHGTFVEVLAPRLLRVTPGFAPIEPLVDDARYVGALIVVLGAVRHNASLLASLPEYVWKHYQQLRVRYADVFPDLQACILSRARHVIEYDLDGSHDTDGGAATPATTSSSTSTATAATTTATAAAAAPLLADRSTADAADAITAGLSAVPSARAALLAEREEEAQRQLRACLAHVRPVTASAQPRARAVARCLDSVLSVLLSVQQHSARASALSFNRAVQDVNGFVTRYPYLPASVLMSVQGVLRAVQAHANPTAAMSVVLTRLGDINTASYTAVTQVAAEITSPHDAPTGVPLASRMDVPILINVEAVVTGVSAAAAVDITRRLRVRVRLPDNSSVVARPGPGEVLRDPAHRQLRVATSLLIRQPRWTHPAPVLLSVAMLAPRDPDAGNAGTAARVDDEDRLVDVTAQATRLIVRPG